MSFIVVGIDGSESAYKALVAAVEQAKMIGAEVRVVNVVVLPAMSGYEFGPIDLDAMRAAAQTTLDSAIERIDAEYNGDTPVTITSSVLTGHVGIEILRAAQADEGAAMVVSGSRGFGGFKSLLLGSVTTYLAHHLTCPLLIIPAAEDDD